MQRELKSIPGVSLSSRTCLRRTLCAVSVVSQNELSSGHAPHPTFALFHICCWLLSALAPPIFCTENLYCDSFGCSKPWGSTPRRFPTKIWSAVASFSQTFASCTLLTCMLFSADIFVLVSELYCAVLGYSTVKKLQGGNWSGLVRGDYTKGTPIMFWHFQPLYCSAKLRPITEKRLSLLKYMSTWIGNSSLVLWLCYCTIVRGICGWDDTYPWCLIFVIDRWFIVAVYF